MAPIVDARNIRQIFCVGTKHMSDFAAEIFGFKKNLKNTLLGYIKG